MILVDANEAILESIRDELDILTIHADGTSPSLMRDPDIRKSDFLVAATASDESNIIASILAKQNGIPHTIARIREMKYLSEPASYLHENFDIDLILSPELITAREIFQLLRTPHALNIEDFAGGRVRLLETKLSTTSPLCRSTQVFHSPAKAHGRPSARRNRHHTFLPVSQQGSSKERAGTMQRCLSRQASRKAGFPAASSARQLLVAYFNTGVFDHEGTSHQLHTASSSSPAPSGRRNGPRARGNTSLAHCG